MRTNELERQRETALRENIIMMQEMNIGGPINAFKH